MSARRPQQMERLLMYRRRVYTVGDFNGDGFDDAIAFVRNTDTDLQGDAYVALSTGGRVAPAQKGSDWICVGYEFCSVGDFNGDQRDDVIAFVRNNDLGPAQGDVWVALSTGTGFALAEKWSDWICVAEEVCAVGDFDRDYIDDIIAFSRNATGAQGDAYVAVMSHVSADRAGERRFCGSEVSSRS